MRKHSISSFLTGFILVIPTLLSAAPDSADNLKKYSALSDEQVITRLKDVQAGLNSGEGNGRLWFGGFLGAYSALTVGAIAAAGTTEYPESNLNQVLVSQALGLDSRLTNYLAAREVNYVDITPEKQALVFSEFGLAGVFYTIQMDEAYKEAEEIRHGKQDMVANAWSSGLGAILLALDSYKPAFSPGKFRALAAGTPEARKRKLAWGEHWLEQGANQNRSARGWLNQTITIGGSALISAAYFGSYHRSAEDALLLFASNVIVAEIQIFSMPKSSESAWDSYSRKYALSKKNARVNTLQFAGLAVHPGGFRAVFTF